MATTSKIQFGDGLTVTDVGSGIIRVDGGGGGAGGSGFEWEDVGSSDGAGLSGIFFDTNNIGGSLFVQAAGAGAAGYGMALVDTGPSGINIDTDATLRMNGDTGVNLGSGSLLDVTAESIHLTTIGGELTIEADAYVNLHTDSTFNVSAHDKLSLYSQTGDVELEAVGFYDKKVRLLVNATKVEVAEESIGLNLPTTGTVFNEAQTIGLYGQTLIQIPTAVVDGRFRVADATGRTLLEARADGTLHMRAGANWIADLP